MKKSVVIVEGYDELRGHLEAILESATDILCLGAFDSGEEARPEILERRPDVVLMDFNLPGRSGIQWVAEIKTVLPAIHVIMVPVYEANALIFQALKAGASGYWVKSREPQELLSAIRTVCQGGAPLSVSIARSRMAVRPYILRNSNYRKLKQ